MKVTTAPGSWLGETIEKIENHYQLGDGQKLPILSSSLFRSFVYFPSSHTEASAPLCSLQRCKHEGRLACLVSLYHFCTEVHSKTTKGTCVDIYK